MAAYIQRMDETDIDLPCTKHQLQLLCEYHDLDVGHIKRWLRLGFKMHIGHAVIRLRSAVAAR